MSRAIEDHADGDVVVVVGLVEVDLADERDRHRSRARDPGQAQRAAGERGPVVGHQAEGLGGQEGEDGEVDPPDLEEGIRQQEGDEGREQRR